MAAPESRVRPGSILSAPSVSGLLALLSNRRLHRHRRNLYRRATSRRIGRRHARQRRWRKGVPDGADQRGDGDRGDDHRLQYESDFLLSHGSCSCLLRGHIASPQIHSNRHAAGEASVHRVHSMTYRATLNGRKDAVENLEQKRRALVRKADAIQVPGDDGGTSARPTSSEGSSPECRMRRRRWPALCRRPLNGRTGRFRKTVERVPFAKRRTRCAHPFFGSPLGSSAATARSSRRGERSRRGRAGGASRGRARLTASRRGRDLRHALLTTALLGRPAGAHPQLQVDAVTGPAGDSAPHVDLDDGGPVGLRTRDDPGTAQAAVDAHSTPRDRHAGRQKRHRENDQREFHGQNPPLHERSCAALTGNPIPGKRNFDATGDRVEIVWNQSFARGRRPRAGDPSKSLNAGRPSFLTAG